MEPTRPMANLIGFDAHPGAAGALNRGRRSTDPGNQRFAEVFDIAAYAASGSRDAARVDTRAAAPLVQVAPVRNSTSTLTVAPTAPPVDAGIEAAADRLFLHLTTGWNPGGQQGNAPIVMRLQDSSGNQLAQRFVPAPHDEGPEVA